MQLAERPFIRPTVLDGAAEWWGYPERSRDHQKLLCCRMGGVLPRYLSKQTKSIGWTVQNGRGIGGSCRDARSPDLPTKRIRPSVGQCRMGGVLSRREGLLSFAWPGKVALCQRHMRPP